MLKHLEFNHENRRAVLSRVTIPLLGAVALAVMSCRPDHQFEAGEIARVDDHVIRAADLNERFWQGPTDVRRRALRKGGRRFLVDLVIDERLLHREAQRRELSPHFSHVKAHHEALMKRFLRAELDPRLRPSDVTAEQLEAEYARIHPELTTPPRRRLMVLAAKTSDEAQALLVEAREARFEDSQAKMLKLFLGQEAGGLSPQKGQFDEAKAETYLGREVAEAAFATSAEEGIHPAAVRYQDGFGVVLVLAELEPPAVPPLTKVEDQLRQRVFQRMRDEALTDFVDTFRAEHEVVVNADVVELVPWVPELPDPEPSM